MLAGSSCAAAYETASQWQPLKNEYSDLFHVYFLHRDRAAEATRAQIESLDTFHPVIVINQKGTDAFPGAMWIEQNHPIGSKFAYHVKFVDPTDAAKDDRLEKYARKAAGASSQPPGCRSLCSRTICTTG